MPPIRASGIQSGNFSGPVGSTIGQQATLRLVPERTFALDVVIVQAPLTVAGAIATLADAAPTPDRRGG